VHTTHHEGATGKQDPYSDHYDGDHNQYYREQHLAHADDCVSERGGIGGRCITMAKSEAAHGAFARDT